MSLFIKMVMPASSPAVACNSDIVLHMQAVNTNQGFDKLSKMVINGAFDDRLFVKRC